MAGTRAPCDMREEPASPNQQTCQPPFQLTNPNQTGVLTKVDIMDRGTDCRDVLLGKTLKLKHGWVAVVNRGQADLNSKVGEGSGGSRPGGRGKVSAGGGRGGRWRQAKGAYWGGLLGVAAAGGGSSSGWGWGWGWGSGEAHA